MIKLGLGIDDDDIPAAADSKENTDDIPPLEGEAEDASNMEEVD